MPLMDEQYEYRGLVFGRDCPVRVNSAEGIEGFEVRTSDSDQPRGDGALRGIDYLAPRTIAFELNIAELEDVEGATYEQLWATVRRVFRPSRQQDYPLVFKRPGMPERQVMCRPIQLTRQEEWSTFNRYAYPPVVLRAVDPRIYSVAEQTVMVPLFGLADDRVDLPVVDFPLDFPTPTRFLAVVRNEGETPSYPLLRFYGPQSGTCARVRVTNTTNGQVFDARPSGLVPGSVMTADMRAAVTAAPGLVVSIDGSTRYGAWALPREPLTLNPGDNLLRFEAEGTGTPTCLVTWRSTWDS